MDRSTQPGRSRAGIGSHICPIPLVLPPGFAAFIEWVPQAGSVGCMGMMLYTYLHILQGGHVPSLEYVEHLIATGAGWPWGSLPRVRVLTR